MRKHSQGQASIEYILMLSTAFLLFLILFKTFLKPVLGRVAAGASTRINQLFNNSDLHRLPFRQ